MEASAVPRVAPAGATWQQSPHLMRLASDARLVALIREGRRVAFEVAYDRHHLAILSFCRHMLGDPQEAEDAVQHTFLAAYNDLISSDKPIQLKAWLFAIARNRCYSVLRARREHPATDLADTATEGLAVQVQRRQDLRDLVVDMRRLPDEQRAALVLAELDALSHEQIGVALGVPREKVKALVFQARESLVASRTARETDCTEIRTQLANLRGGALRRGNLRRHLRECPGCRDFRHQVERQRRQLALLLPVAPAFALKEGVVTAALTGGAGAAAGLTGGAGLLAGTAMNGGLMKGAIGIAVAAVGAGTLAAAGDLGLSWSSSGLPPKQRQPTLDPGSARTGSAAVGQPTALTAAQGFGGAAGWGWRISLTGTHQLSLAAGANAGPGHLSPHWPSPRGAGAGRRQIRVAPMAGRPAQRGSSEGTAGSSGASAPSLTLAGRPAGPSVALVPGSGNAGSSSSGSGLRIGSGPSSSSGSGAGSSTGSGGSHTSSGTSGTTHTQGGSGSSTSGSGSSGGSTGLGGGSGTSSPGISAPSGAGSTSAGSGTGKSGSGAGGSGATSGSSGGGSGGSSGSSGGGSGGSGGGSGRGGGSGGGHGG